MNDLTTFDTLDLHSLLHSMPMSADIRQRIETELERREQANLRSANQLRSILKR
jgi:hypothetical protein